LAEFVGWMIQQQDQSLAKLRTNNIQVDKVMTKFDKLNSSVTATVYDTVKRGTGDLSAKLQRDLDKKFIDQKIALTEIQKQMREDKDQTLKDLDQTASLKASID